MHMPKVATPPHLGVRGECRDLPCFHVHPCAQDGTVKVWEWFSGRLLCSEQVGEVPPDGGDGGVTDAVTKVTCSRTDPPMVVAASEKSVLYMSCCRCEKNAYLRGGLGYC